jgi:hypothetical protein
MTTAELALLLRLHDGDDRCGCLRDALLDLANDGTTDVATRIRECLEQHPSGSSYYRNN